MIAACFLNIKMTVSNKMRVLLVRYSLFEQQHNETQDPLSIVTMLNRYHCNFAGYAETKTIIFAMLCLMYAKGLF